MDGLLDLLARHGIKSRAEVMAPAIALAEQGFELDHYLARHFNTVGANLQKNPAAAKVFTKNGRALAKGDIWQQPDLAKTLRRISEKGRKGFYEGETADLIVAEMQRGGGIISHEDLQQYRSVWREPVYGTYRGHEIWSMGPPSSGGALIVQILNMLEPYDVAKMGWGSAQLIHLMVEAERRAYADRAEHLGDPDFFDVPLAMLTDKSYAASRFKDFDPDKAAMSESVYPGEINRY